MVDEIVSTIEETPVPANEFHGSPFFDQTQIASIYADVRMYTWDAHGKLVETTSDTYDWTNP
jgi:hypothetical protein